MKCMGWSVWRVPMQTACLGHSVQKARYHQRWNKKRQRGPSRTYFSMTEVVLPVLLPCMKKTIHPWKTTNTFMYFCNCITFIHSHSPSSQTKYPHSQAYYSLRQTYSPTKQAYIHPDRNTVRTESLVSMNNRNLPYDCIKDTSKITRSIIHEHKYT